MRNALAISAVVRRIIGPEGAGRNQIRDLLLDRQAVIVVFRPLLGLVEFLEEPPLGRFPAQLFALEEAVQEGGRGFPRRILEAVQFFIRDGLRELHFFASGR